MNTCCEGQGTRIFGSLPEYIYSIAKDGIYVNVYTSAEINYAIQGQPIRIAMHSGFPYDPDIKILINSDQLRFSIAGNTEFEYWPYFEIQDEHFSCFPEFFR